MNRSILALLVIFLLGGVCGAVIHSWMDRPTTPPRSPLESAGPLSEEQTGRSPEPPTPSTRLIREVKPFNWSQLESTDYKKYVANLRAIGCPEKTIRDLIRAELDALYRPRYAALEQEMAGSSNYWQPRTDQGPGAHYIRESHHRQLEREKEALLNELLGDPNRPPDAANAPARSDGIEPSQWTRETREKVHEIQQKYHLLEDNIHHTSRGEIFPEDAARIAELRRQRIEELSTVLSPEQLHEFELRESNTAERLRNELLAFSPTEEEYRAIFDIQRSLEQELGLTEFHFDSPEFQAQRESVELARNEQLRELLGEERFADYQLATDHRYRDLYRLGERFELPEENIRNMFDLWQNAERQADQIRGNDTLSELERGHELDLLRQQVQDDGLAFLGEEGFYNYRSRGGEWMRHLFETH